jgi:hypothetical protein
VGHLPAVRVAERRQLGGIVAPSFRAACAGLKPGATYESTRQFELRGRKPWTAVAAATAPVCRLGIRVGMRPRRKAVAAATRTPYKTSRQFRQATFSSLQTFLQGTAASFLYDPAPTEMNWRSLYGAWYAEDVIRLGPRLTLLVGERHSYAAIGVSLYPATQL